MISKTRRREQESSEEEPSLMDLFIAMEKDPGYDGIRSKAGSRIAREAMRLFLVKGNVN